MHPSVHHVGIQSPSRRTVPLADLSAALPLKPCVALDLGGPPSALLAGPNAFIDWHEASDGEQSSDRAINAPGIAHLCLQGRDGGALRTGMEEAGTRFFAQPVELGTGFSYAYARAADGRLLELEAAPVLPDQPSAWFAHLAFISERADELAKFYAAILDAPLVAGGRFRNNALMDRMAALEGVDVEIWWVKSSPISLEFFRYHAPSGGECGRGIAAYSHLGIEVADLPAAVEQVLAHGGSQNGAATVGADGRSAWMRDPDGNLLRLVQLNEARCSVASLAFPEILSQASAAREA
jgi:catechol 2,3-dioxygenase-like lactoylglutathione lyase family enzyme